MKIRITQKGVFDKDGKPIEVGTELDIKGKNVPAWLVNKGEIVAEKTAKSEPVTNTPTPTPSA